MANIETVIALVESRKGKNKYTQNSELRSKVFDGYSDCSSLMWKCFQKGANLEIGTYTDAQWGNGDLIYLNTGSTHVVTPEIQSISGMKRGDLLFWASSSASSGRICSHVEMYLGNNKCIGHGSGIGPTEKVLNTYIHPNRFLGVRRYIENSSDVRNYHTGNFYLNNEQMFTNAYYLYGALSKMGWTLNAICGFLGNTQIESTHNPGIYQSLNPNHAQPWGYGLTQWTPWTKYTEWCTANGYQKDTMEGALARIQYEIDNPGVQWVSRDIYKESFLEFTKSTKEPEYLAYCFMYNYENPNDKNQPVRKTYARYWYEQFQGLTPPNPDPPTPVLKHRTPLWMLIRRSIL